MIEKKPVGNMGIRSLQAWISNPQLRTTLALFLSVEFFLLMVFFWKKKNEKNEAMALVLKVIAR